LGNISKQIDFSSINEDEIEKAIDKEVEEFRIRLEQNSPNQNSNKKIQVNFQIF